MTWQPILPTLTIPCPILYAAQRLTGPPLLLHPFLLHFISASCTVPVGKNTSTLLSCMPSACSCHLYAWRTGDSAPTHQALRPYSLRQVCATLLICTCCTPADPSPAKHFAPDLARSHSNPGADFIVQIAEIGSNNTLGKVARPSRTFSSSRRKGIFVFTKTTFVSLVSQPFALIFSAT